MAFTWRPPQELKEKLQYIAKKMGIPLSNLLIIICNDYLKNNSKWVQELEEKE